MHNLDRDRPTNKSVVQLDLCKALQGPIDVTDVACEDAAIDDEASGEARSQDAE